MRTLTIVLIRCPQPLLIGAESGGLYSPNRLLTPEPTLPQLAGILNVFSETHNIPVEVVQLDLRDPHWGRVQEIQYGNLTLPYLGEPLRKVWQGVPFSEVMSILEEADIIGFTNNFTMSRRVVADCIGKVRDLFPEKELWVGGRDVFTDRVIDVYVRAAARKNLVVFEGHVFDSLPAYLLWKVKGVGEPFGLTVYDEEGRATKTQPKPLNIHGREIAIPLPVYHRPESLSYFTGSGEGEPNPPFGRFVHMTISIGCPRACGYCTTGYRERYLVHKDMATIDQELKMYKSMGVTVIGIMDDNLLALGPDKVQDIMGLVNQYGFGIEYGNGLQLSLLAKHWSKFVGPIFKQCVSLYAPLEDLTRDRMYQKLETTNSQLALMRRLARERPGLLKYVTMGVIIGVPGHTKKALETTFLENIERFLNAFTGSNIEVGTTAFNFMPLAGTVFGEQALDSGRMVVADPISVDPEVCSFGTTSYAPEGMSHKEVFDLYEEALNLNPAGRKLGIPYTTLQRLGERALPEDERWKIPPQWRTPGFHLRAKMT
ncbi:hypothetical protein HQ544_01425 [Candidatus Falkowbacteria bacterium]|nr:hypothetical protein [Candidatus Falkowbacteria bacterium]